MGNRAKIREKVKTLNPIDDVFFQVMASDKLVCQEILRTILQDPKLIVVRATPQRELRNLQGRTVRLDLDCILGTGKHVIMEVQKKDNDDHQKRVRYNGSCLTVNITDPGLKFKNVPNVTSIFISLFDVFKMGNTVYHVERIVREEDDEEKEKVENGFTFRIYQDGRDC